MHRPVRTALLVCLLSLCVPFPVVAQIVAPAPSFRVYDTEDDLPSVCTPNALAYLRLASQGRIWARCIASGTDWQIEAVNPVGGTVPPASQIVWSDGTGTVGSSGQAMDSTSIVSQKHKVTAIGTSSALGLHSVVLVTALPITLSLPPASTTTAGRYKIIITTSSGSNLTLAPTGNNTINGSTTPLTVTGLYSGFDVIWLGTTGWYVETLAGDLFPSGAGASPTDEGDLQFDTTKHAWVSGWNGSTTLTHSVGLPGCMSSGGDANTATTTTDTLQHSLTCALPANFLTAHKEVTVCSAWRVSTGTSTIPTLTIRLRAGSTTLVDPISAGTPSGSMANDGFMLCYMLHAASAPGASVSVYSYLISRLGSLNSGFDRNNLTQPISLATNAAITLNFQSEWSDAGTGTNIVTLDFISGSARN